MNGTEDSAESPVHGHPEWLR